jgi:hypothetical protein
LKRTCTLAADGSLASRTAPQAPEARAAGLGVADIPDRCIDQFLIAQRYAGPLHVRAWQPNMSTRNSAGFFFQSCKTWVYNDTIIMLQFVQNFIKFLYMQHARPHFSLLDDSNDIVKF